MNFSERLELVSRTLKLAKQTIAEDGGVSAQTITAYIKGETLPSQKTLANWVHAYKLDAHWLLTGEGEMMAGRQSPTLTTPLAQRVDQVAQVMSDSGVDEMELLRAVRAMVDGEMDKLARLRGGSGVVESTTGMTRAAADSAPDVARKIAAGGNPE